MRRSVATARRFPLRPAAAVFVLALLALLMGCGGGDPQNTFAPAGDVAKDQRDLLIFWVLGPAAAIFVIVEGLLIFALLRFRQKRGEAPPRQVHGNTRLEIAWTVAPAVLLLVIAVPMVALIVDLGRAPAEDALRVRVTGFQWAWQFEYLEFTGADGEPLTSLGELHIPVGREIGVELESRDVVHSFWVPRLAGKFDVFPVQRDTETGEIIAGRVNRFWFNATEPGSFSGQCAEFCGLGHADMRMVIMAETEEEFQQWVNEQLAEQQAAKPGSAESRVASYGE